MSRAMGRARGESGGVGLRGTGKVRGRGMVPGGQWSGAGPGGENLLEQTSHAGWGRGVVRRLCG